MTKAQDDLRALAYQVLQTIEEKAAFADRAYYEEITGKIVASRELLTERLGALGWQVLPSKANFVFARKPGVGGRDVYTKLKERGILVRYFDVPGIQDFVRITIGTPEALQRLLGEISAIFETP